MGDCSLEKKPKKKKADPLEVKLKEKEGRDSQRSPDLPWLSFMSSLSNQTLGKNEKSLMILSFESPR